MFYKWPESRVVGCSAKTAVAPAGVRMVHGRLITRIFTAFILIAGIGSAPAAPARPFQQPATEQSIDTVRSSALLNQYCVGCHNARLKTAGLTIDPTTIDKLGEDPAVWEKVVRKLRTGTMPPANVRRPAVEEYNFLIGYLETGLDAVAVAASNPGRVGVRRLNRTEYGN